MATEKKPLIQRIKDSDFGQFVSNKVAPLLPKAAELLADSNIPGVSLVGKIGQMISDSKEESHELKALDAEFRKFEMQFKLDVMKAEHDHEIAIRQIEKEEFTTKVNAEIEVIKQEVSDVANARNRELEFMKANGGKRDWIMGGLAIYAMISNLLLGCVLVLYEVPAGNKDMFNMFAGAGVISNIALIMNYYFSSSKGSRIKDYAIASNEQARANKSN